MTSFVSSFQIPLAPAASASAPVQFAVAVNESGDVVATAFGGVEALPTRADLGTPVPDERRTARVREEILAYFRGERTAFTVHSAPRGSDFQRRVWQALQEIPLGETRSYGQLAQALRSSARAVGRANATNPVCLLIPCHRVIGADGSLTGFAFGAAIKAALLAHERRLRAGADVEHELRLNSA